MRICILLIVCLLTGSLKAADPVRLDDLGRLRTVSQLTLDPSGGRAVAVVDGFSGVDPQAKKTRELWLIDLEDGRLPRVLTQTWFVQSAHLFPRRCFVVLLAGRQHLAASDVRWRITRPDVVR